ncbi:HEPN domain-containing protein [Candidatus Woesearchaeota archaeon]|nr:HEPN domain-containing protein [Candidatus Woesearchaeota archaeon]
MPQIENKLKWCLNKAKKELTETNKHRGLVQLAPNTELAYQYITKAEHNLKAIDYFAKGGFSDWSISAGFYSIYHCFLALLAKNGYESRNQECTIAAIEHLIEQKKIALEQKFIDALKQYGETKHAETTVIELREQLQYGISLTSETTQLEKLKQLCKEAIYDTKELLAQK